MDSFTHRLNELLLWPLEKEDFFMSLIAVQSNNSNKIGTCPHGLPQGACPICSGMGGGMKKADFSAKPGEMSWNECAAIGAFLKAQKMAKLQREQDAQNFANNVRTFQNAMMNANQKLANIGGFFSQNTPSIIAKPVNFVLNTVLGGIARGIANIPTTISNIIQTVQQKLADISDKLTAIIGELKTMSFGNNLAYGFGMLALATRHHRSYKKGIRKLQKRCRGTSDRRCQDRSAVYL